MKKLVVILILSISIIGCTGQHKIKQEKHTLLKEIVINYSKEDSNYIYYGYYKEVRRIYNYQYKDSFMYSYTLDSNHHVNAFYNEYGDTIHKIYVDTTNYPRREE